MKLPWKRDSEPSAAIDTRPRLYGVRVKPIMFGSDPVRFDVYMDFITVAGTRSIIINTSTTEDAANTLAAQIMRELEL